MGLVKIQAPPGFNNQTTQTGASGGWWTGNLIRWRSGFVEKYAGWKRLVQNPFAHFIRRMHAWLDLEDRKGLLVGTDKGLQLFVGGTQYDLATSVPLPDPRQATWFLDNFGEFGLALATHGPLLIYKPPPLPNPFPPPSVAPVAEAPISSHGMFVAMTQAQIIIWGTNSDIEDPLI